MGRVWFGTREQMQWVPDPAVEVRAGKSGWQMAANFQNGGAAVRRSKTSAKSYGFSWNLKTRDEIRPILDYADGIYGDTYIYYVNPFAQDKNVFPSYWATPFMNAYDGPVTIGGVRPTLSLSGVSNGYPRESAVYTLTTTSTVPSIYLPIPEDCRAYIGAHGASLTGTTTVRVRPHTGLSVGSWTNLTLLPKTGVLTNYISASGVTGIEVSMVATVNGTLRLDGLVAQMLPAGSVAPSGAFISGQGQSGMLFASQPVVSEYSAAMDKVGVSAELIEVEAWT